jgi:hypothetical protein
VKVVPNYSSEHAASVSDAVSGIDALAQSKPLIKISRVELVRMEMFSKLVACLTQERDSVIRIGLQIEILARAIIWCLLTACLHRSKIDKASDLAYATQLTTKGIDGS